MRRKVAAWLRFVADRLDPPPKPLMWVHSYTTYTTSNKWKVGNG